MKVIIRNIVVFIMALVIGSVVNMSLIMVSGHVIPPPNGADVTTMEGLQASLHLFEPKHFIFPFLAHALGTFVGAVFVTLLAVSHKMKLALAVGCTFLLGGVMNVFMLPAPLWFCALDLIGAYLPMAWLGTMLAQKFQAPASAV